jgi:hypothetical protein
MVSVALTAEQASKQHEQTLFAERKRMAKGKIYNLVCSYPKDTSDDWVIFGYGGVRISLGDMKDLFGIDR